VAALVVDSSSWVSYLAGGGARRTIDAALGEARLFLPPVVAAELLSGRLGKRELAALEGLLARLPLCPSARAHWYRVGRLRAALSAGGLSVSIPDAHVAQCALDLGAWLLTEDRVFRAVARHAPLRLAAE
jgi:predicted nucleic acid-binding protein